MQIDLNALGLSPERIEAAVIDAIVTQLTQHVREDPETGDQTGYGSSEFKNRLSKLVQARIDERVDAIGKEHILPKIDAMVESLTLQETTTWGEKKGAPKSFIEYMTERADAYMREDVDYDGHTKSEKGYNWSKSQTRITHLVHRHLQYSIEKAMKQALANANSSIIKGLEETVKIKLAEVAKNFAVTVKS